MLANPAVGGTPAPSPTAYTPAQIKHAYGFDQISFAGIVGDGSGQTIAIVDAYDQPNIASDLQAFDLRFGLPDPPSFLKLDQNGGTVYPAPDVPLGWGLEISLDVEWAHALAPKANIILFEANDASYANMMTAVNTARNYPGVTVVSMSFSSDEFAGETALDPIFTTPAGHVGVTFLASTGDWGSYPDPQSGYPALSPNVVAVGGTSLNADALGNYITETGWAGSGGGISQFEAKPAYQNTLVTQSNTRRCAPDVAFDADPLPGVPVYDSYDGQSPPVSGNWYAVGGTSFSCPAWAALIAIVNQGRSLIGKPSLDGPSQTLPMLYKLPWSDFHDILTGNNGFPCGPGFDLVTGRGSPNAARLTADMVGAVILKPYFPARYVYNPRTRLFTGNVTVATNIIVPVSGTLQLTFTALPRGVTLANATGTTGGKPYISVAATLSSTRSFRLQIKLSNPYNMYLGSFFNGLPVQITLS
jgi:subtilase family serine protease